MDQVRTQPARKAKTVSSYPFVVEEHLKDCSWVRSWGYRLQRTDEHNRCTTPPMDARYKFSQFLFPLNDVEEPGF